MSQGLSEIIKIDDAKDLLEVYGYKLSGDIFRGLTSCFPIGDIFRIDERKDGVIVATHFTDYEKLKEENQRLKEAIQSTLSHISSLSNPKYCTIERIDLITDRLKQALEGGKK